jgi:hypothetical protein
MAAVPRAECTIDVDETSFLQPSLVGENAIFSVSSVTPPAIRIELFVLLSAPVIEAAVIFLARSSSASIARTLDFDVLIVQLFDVMG